MKRGRISVSPSRAAALAAVFVLCALPAIMMNSLPGYFGVLFLFFLCVISFVYALIVSRGVVCEGLSAEESCRRGGSLPLRLSVTNNSRLVCVSCEAELYTTDIFGGIRTSESLRFTFAPRETRSFGFDVSFDHVGEYKAGLRYIKTQGLLGVVSFVREFSLAKSIKALPLCHEVEALALSDIVHNESINASRVSIADSIDYSGVREYSVGDPIKLIHWNLSSHTGNYMTKLMESYGSSSLTLIPCSLTGEYGAEASMSAYDCITELCLSLGALASSRGVDCELLYEDGAGEASRYPFQSEEAFSELIMSVIPAPRASSGCETLERMLKHESARRYSSSNIAVCTSRLSDYAAKQILELKRRRKNIILFYVQPYDTHDAAADKALNTLRAADIEIHVVASAEEIGRRRGQ